MSQLVIIYQIQLPPHSHHVSCGGYQKSSEAGLSTIRNSIVAIIPACHAGDPSSILGCGGFLPPLKSPTNHPQNDLIVTIFCSTAGEVDKPRLITVECPLMIIQTQYSMSISNWKHKDEALSRRSTEEDSSSDYEADYYPYYHCKTNPAKHKTELCKTYSMLGRCPYEDRCRFAHGRHELVKVGNPHRSKHRKCHGFWKRGVCSYGSRCQFGHATTSWEDKAALLGLQALCSGSEEGVGSQKFRFNTPDIY